MKRYQALIRDTWWLWGVLFGAGLIAGIFVHFSFFSAFPIGIFSFFYFGLMRYDKEGNPTEGFGDQ